jgi:hypothetical protein
MLAAVAGQRVVLAGAAAAASTAAGAVRGHGCLGGLRFVVLVLIARRAWRLLLLLGG